MESTGLTTVIKDFARVVVISVVFGVTLATADESRCGEFDVISGCSDTVFVFIANENEPFETELDEVGLAASS